jgi:hypothetical protein
MFEKFGSFLAVATFATISIMVTHEWGYFGVIGRDFQSLFTAYDYIAEFTFWIGPAFVFLLFLVGLQLAFFDPSADADPYVPKTTWGKRLYEWQFEIMYLILILLGFLVLNESFRIWLYILLAILWLRLALFLVRRSPRFTMMKGNTMGHIFALAPMFMILFYGLVPRHSDYDSLDVTG